MAFSWNLFCAQKANQALMVCCLCDRSLGLVQDRGAPAMARASKPGLHQCVYVHNLGACSDEVHQVEDAVGRVEWVFTEWGFLFYKFETQAHSVDMLGVPVGGLRKFTCIQNGRDWRLRRGFGAALCRASMSGQALGILTCHATYACLVARPTMPMFCFCYKHLEELRLPRPSVVRGQEGPGVLPRDAPAALYGLVAPTVLASQQLGRLRGRQRRWHRRAARREGAGNWAGAGAIAIQARRSLRS